MKLSSKILSVGAALALSSCSNSAPKDTVDHERASTSAQVKALVRKANVKEWEERIKTDCKWFEVFNNDSRSFSYYGCDGNGKHLGTGRVLSDTEVQIQCAAVEDCAQMEKHLDMQCVSETGSSRQDGLIELYCRDK